MPRFPAIPHPALAQLERELRHSSREALLRDIERIELLACDIDPALAYPLEWLIFRITGFRPLTSPPGPPVAGSAVLACLTPLCENLCLRAELHISEIVRSEYLSFAEAARDWNISNSTLQRIRRQGLVSRAALTPAGTSTGLIHRDVARRFAARWPHLLSRTRGKQRLDACTQQRMRARAARYVRVLGLSPHAIATRLARRFGVSVEGCRQLLARSGPGFAVSSHRSPATRVALLRLANRGASPSQLAHLLASRGGARVASVRRDLALARAMLLREWTAPWRVPAGPALSAPNARAALQPPGVRTNLLHVVPTDLAEFLVVCRGTRPTPAQRERELALALAALRDETLRAAASLAPLHPSPTLLDAAHTNLRWCSLLHRQLLATQGRLLMDTIDLRAQKPCEQLPLPALLSVLRAALSAASDTILVFDATKGGRLAGAAALAIDRAVTRALRDVPTQPTALNRPAAARAQPVLMHGVQVTLTSTMLAWERWLTPWFVREPLSHRLSPAQRCVLQRYFALDGDAPWTQLALAEHLAIHPPQVAALLSKALSVQRAACLTQSDAPPVPVSMLNDAPGHSRVR